MFNYVVGITNTLTCYRYEKYFSHRYEVFYERKVFYKLGCTTTVKI